jgi:hypothetical protein
MVLREFIVAGKAVEKRPEVDPRDEPSAAWGWHGSFPKGTRIAGWVSAAILLVMIKGNHENNTENVWLVGLAALLVLLLVLDIRKRRTAWRK